METATQQGSKKAEGKSKTIEVLFAQQDLSPLERVEIKVLPLRKQEK
jgi:hypothetical protein